jgi:hypothetical protein
MRDYYVIARGKIGQWEYLDTYDPPTDTLPDTSTWTRDKRQAFTMTRRDAVMRWLVLRACHPSVCFFRY